MRTFVDRLPGLCRTSAGLVAVGLIAVACGSSPGTPGAGKTVTVTAPPVTRTVTASPSPRPAGPGPCLSSDLRLTIGASDGAAGTVYYPIDFTNASSSACTMYGYPGVSFVTAPGGQIIGAPAGRGSAAGVTPVLITLQPGATAHATLGVSDVILGDQCHSHQVPVSTIRVYPPGEYTALFAPFSGSGCADRSLVIMYVSPVAKGS